MRELPCHGGAVQRLVEKQPPCGGRVQRLPYAARPCGEVLDEGAQRFLALVLFHHWDIPLTHPYQSAQRTSHRTNVPRLSSRRGGGDRSGGLACRWCTELRQLPSERRTSSLSYGKNGTALDWTSRSLHRY